MKINRIAGYNQNFGHISKRAVDAVRSNAEGYKMNNKTGEAFYSTNPKYNMMNTKELKRLENLVSRASVLDTSWIDYDSQDDSLVIDFYKDCNPWLSYGFDPQKEGNISDALDILECAVGEAETGEYADIDENKNSGFIWRVDKASVNHTPERFRNIDDNKVLTRIYSKTFDIKA